MKRFEVDDTRRRHGSRSAERTAGPAVTPASGTTIAGSVTRVIDGDSIRVSGHGPDIRLFGVDAPEMSTTAGHRARDKMLQLADDKRLTCHVRDRDRYGRTVANCITETGRDIGLALIRSGHATEYCYYSRNFYGTCG